MRAEGGRISRLTHIAATSRSERPRKNTPEDPAPPEADAIPPKRKGGGGGVQAWGPEGPLPAALADGVKTQPETDGGARPSVGGATRAPDVGRARTCEESTGATSFVAGAGVAAVGAPTASEAGAGADGVVGAPPVATAETAVGSDP